jgi:hypothetical protein
MGRALNLIGLLYWYLQFGQMYRCAVSVFIALSLRERYVDVVDLTVICESGTVQTVQNAFTIVVKITSCSPRSETFTDGPHVHIKPVVAHNYLHSDGPV